MEPVLIVVEGPDRTGKTTLATRLAQEVRGTVRHAGPPQRGAIEEYETGLDDFDPRGPSLVLDRWHVGEYVWPTIFERPSDFLLPVRKHVEMFMQSRGAFVVFADRNTEKLKQDLVEHDEPLKPDDLDLARSLFSEARAFAEDICGLWDYEKWGDREVQLHVEHARHKEHSVTPIWNVVGPGWVGSPFPQLLLIGDELGPEKESRTPPFDVPFAPYPGTSGWYLMEYLDDLWRKVAIINSKRERTGEVRDLYAVWETFGRPRTVALGRNAAAALEEFDVPYTLVPHPQYWRRFRHREGGVYTNMLREAMWA